SGDLTAALILRYLLQPALRQLEKLGIEKDIADLFTAIAQAVVHDDYDLLISFFGQKLIESLPIDENVKTIVSEYVRTSLVTGESVDLANVLIAVIRSVDQEGAVPALLEAVFSGKKLDEAAIKKILELLPEEYRKCPDPELLKALKKLQEILTGSEGVDAEKLIEALEEIDKIGASITKKERRLKWLVHLRDLVASLKDKDKPDIGRAATAAGKLVEELAKLLPKGKTKEALDKLAQTLPEVIIYASISTDMLAAIIFFQQAVEEWKKNTDARHEATRRTLADAPLHLRIALR